MDRPRLLDLFCCAGGAAMGYHLAGFEVVGVDVRPQPRYPFAFVQADATTFPLDGFEAVHASPPCQAYSAATPEDGRRRHPDLVGPTRERLIASGLPYVIENVVGAPLRNPVMLCGSSFGLAVQRHRLFETNFPVWGVPCAHHLQQARRYPATRPGRGRSRVVQVNGNGGGEAKRAELWAAAMGIDWMIKAELAQAIPPAYTRHVGEALLAEVRRRRGDDPGRERAAAAPLGTLT